MTTTTTTTGDEGAAEPFTHTRGRAEWKSEALREDRDGYHILKVVDGGKREEEGKGGGRGQG